ncbi:MAG: ribonuclease I, partial [Elusimicrobia bacterium]|nr:ribonuclease I [Elusimicrobiota bacterium]
ACGKLPPGSAADRRFTLHGLWADLPRGLAAEGMEKGTWYKYGCYWFRPGRALPKSMCDDPPLKLSPRVRRALDARMPGRLGCLDRHEFDKHAACYGFEPDAFFTRALGLLKKLNASRFTSYVRARRGRTVARKDLERAFAEAFHLKDASALALRCGRRTGSQADDVLIQAWVTVRRDGVDSFPAKGSFLAGAKGNCAERVFVAR